MVTFEYIGSHGEAEYYGYQIEGSPDMRDSEIVDLLTDGMPIYGATLYRDVSTITVYPA